MEPSPEPMKQTHARICIGQGPYSEQRYIGGGEYHFWHRRRRRRRLGWNQSAAAALTKELVGISYHAIPPVAGLFLIGDGV